jgi:hypothetical protein
MTFNSISVTDFSPSSFKQQQANSLILTMLACFLLGYPHVIFAKACQSNYNKC